jgi:predicted alpha/beta hydrolase family esterase
MTNEEIRELEDILGYLQNAITSLKAPDYPQVASALGNIVVLHADAVRGAILYAVPAVHSLPLAKLNRLQDQFNLLNRELQRFREFLTTSANGNVPSPTPPQSPLPKS